MSDITKGITDCLDTINKLRDENTAQAVRIETLEAALNKINDKDSYPNGGFGPFAEIARAALEGGKDD